MLDLARALQGVGGAALFATALALIGHEYRGVERFGALAIWGATVGAAVASGPLIGGILTDTAGWRWVFYVNVPIGIFALFLALTRMSESRDVDARRTDVAGLVSFSAALFLIVFGILRGNAHGWTSGLILGALIGGAALLVAFVVIERRQERPMLDITSVRAASVRGRVDRDVLHRRGHVRALPVPLDLLPGHPRLLAARRGSPLPADDRLRLLRAAHRAPLRGPGADADADRRRSRSRRDRARPDVGPPVADVALDGAASRSRHRRHRDRDRQPGARGCGAPCRRPGANGDGVRDQQHLPDRRSRPRHRGARRPTREPDRGLPRPRRSEARATASRTRSARRAPVLCWTGRPSLMRPRARSSAASTTSC